MLNLGPCISDEVDILLKPLYYSAITKTLKGIPLMVQTEGSEKKGMTAISFIIYDITSSKLGCHGDLDLGITLNKEEL